MCETASYNGNYVLRVPQKEQRDLGKNTSILKLLQLQHRYIVAYSGISSLQGFINLLHLWIEIFFCMSTWKSLNTAGSADAGILLIQSLTRRLISVALVNMQMNCGDLASPPHISINFIVDGITFVIVNSTICSRHLIQVGERLWADDLAIAPLLHSDMALADVKWNEARHSNELRAPFPSPLID